MTESKKTQEQLTIELQELQQKYNALKIINDRKNTNTVQLKSEEKYHLLVEQSGQMMYEYDIPSGKIIWSGDIFTITGYTADEFQKIDILNWEKFIHNDDRKLALLLLNEAINTCSDYKVEYRFKQKNGKYVFIEDNGLFRIDKEGKAEVMFGIMKDITERKQAETALLLSETQLKEAQRIAAIGSWELNLVTDELIWSDEIYNIFEIDKEKFELTSGAFLNSIHPDDRDTVENAYNFSVETKTPYEIDHRLLMSDGRTKYVREHGKTFYNTDGKPLRSIGTVQDVTERKQAEQEIKNLIEKYRGLSEASFECIFLSKKGICIEQNQSAAKKFGYTNDEAIGRKGTDWIAPEYREIVMQNMLAGYEQPYEALAIKKDGTTFPCMLQGKMIHYKEETVRVTSLSDITERKQAEEALKESKEYFKALIENSADVISIIDENGKSLFRSKSHENIMGFTIDEIIGKNVFDFVHPDDRMRLMQQLAESIEKPGEKTDISFRTYHKNGTLHHMEGIGMNMIDSPFIKGIIIHYRDVTERKQAEDALHESEKMFKSIVENMIDGYYRADKDGKIILISPSVEKILGFSEKELIGKKVSQLYARQKERAVFLKEINKTGKIENYIVEFRKKGHNNIFIEINSSIFNDKDHDFAGIEGTFRDITERKQTAEKLLKRDNYLSALNKAKEVLLSSKTETLFQQFIDILGEVSSASRAYVFINHKNEANELLMSQKLEYCAEGIKPEIDNPNLQNLKYDEFFERWHKTLQKGELILGRVADFPIGEKEFLVAQDIKAILIIPIITKNEFIGFMGFDNCVSDKEWDEAEKNFLQAAAGDLAQTIEKNRAAKQLQEEYSRFQTVMNIIDSAIYVADMHTYEILFTNSKFDDSFGKHSGEKCYSVIQKGQTVPCDFCTNNLLLDKKGNPNEPYVWEFQNTKNKRWYQSSDQAIKWVDGRIVRIEIATDITDYKQTEVEIKLKNKELENLNATKDKFFNIIAHDLKSPFNSIVGFSGLLVEQIGVKDYEGIEQYAEIILKSSNRAMDLLTNLMEWARSQTGKIEFNPEYIEINRLVNEIALSFDNIAAQKIISIIRKLPASVTVFADKAMISTVLRNLISNAIKFTHTGGKITISAEINQSEFKVTVSDNGVGISKANIEKLFRIDENYSTSGTNKEKGTGLGLILCKDFVEKHNGNIWVESEEGNLPTGTAGGSTFCFTIPVNNDTKNA